jgi:hypothetical protein
MSILPFGREIHATEFPMKLLVSRAKIMKWFDGPIQIQNKGGEMTTLRRLWRGTYSLGIAFWVFYCFGSLLLVFVAVFLSFGSRFLHAHVIGFLLGQLVSWSYWITASVGVWRSASFGMESKIWLDRIWPLLARGTVLFVAIQVLWRLANGGALRLMELATGPLEFDF